MKNSEVKIARRRNKLFRKLFKLVKRGGKQVARFESKFPSSVLVRGACLGMKQKALLRLSQRASNCAESCRALATRLDTVAHEAGVEHDAQDIRGNKGSKKKKLNAK